MLFTEKKTVNFSLLHDAYPVMKKVNPTSMQNFIECFKNYVV